MSLAAIALTAVGKVQDAFTAAAGWILENKAGAPSFRALRRRDRALEIEEVGRRLRKLMPWIDAKEV